MNKFKFIPEDTFVTNPSEIKTSKFELKHAMGEFEHYKVFPETYKSDILNHTNEAICDCGWDLRVFFSVIGACSNNQTLNFSGVPCPNPNCKASYTFQIKGLNNEKS